MADNQEWMTSLPEQVRNMSIINIAIPGSHNSMSYGINAGAKTAPDAEPSTRRLNRVLPWFVRRWAKTQSATVQEQMRLGVRYFDLRICQKNDKFYYTHGLFAMDVFEPLERVKDFLLTHRNEVCVLDFQHFYAMKVTHHMVLHSQLLKLFGPLLYSTTDGALADCTLNRCKDLGRQVVLVYRRCPLQLPKEFWPSYAWPTPWPNVASAKKLQQFLENSLLSRKATQGYVSQCIITPTGRYIALRCLSSLRKTAKKVDKRLQPWIVSQCPGRFHEREPPKVNVLIGDFVNLNDGQFCDWIISLNTKLGDESQSDLTNHARDEPDANERAL